MDRWSGRTWRSRRAMGATIVAGAIAIGGAGCGGSQTRTGSAQGTSSASGDRSFTLSVVQASYPDSLDPQYGDTSQSAEADLMVYVPLLTYAARSGEAGGQLIPGLARALPTVSRDLRSYSLRLRPGLRYSDGRRVRASDVRHAIERAIRIDWANQSYFTANIVGAAAYAGHRAASISGIRTDDATGAITFRLVRPYGAFANVLALAAAAPVAADTPMTTRSNRPPVGVGPYAFGTIRPNVSYSLVRSPSFAHLGIPGVPTGYARRIDVSVQSNPSSEAELVLENRADLFEPADEIPPGELQRVQARARGRFERVQVAQQDYFFLNTRVAPFNDIRARRAVIMATDRTAIARLSAGAITPGCWFLPPTVVGHQDGPCLGLDPSVSPSRATVARARAMIRSAGLAGTKVTVWSEQNSPVSEYGAYYSTLLDRLGFRATPKTVANSVYFQTMGERRLNQQTGFDDWNQDFPNPTDFYFQLSRAGDQATNNENYGNDVDGRVEAELAALQAVPATRLASLAPRWSALDRYVARRAYVDVFGYGTDPKFTSDRVDFASVVFSPIYHVVFSTVRLTG